MAIHKEDTAADCQLTVLELKNMFDLFSIKIQHLQCKKKKVLLGYLKVLLRIRKSIQLPLLGKRRKLFAIDFS